MIIKGATKQELDLALSLTTKKFAGNIVFRTCAPVGKRFRVTLRALSSGGPGTRYYLYEGMVKAWYNSSWHKGVKKKASSNACWHVYGRFLDYVFALCPDAVVRVRQEKYTLDNWEWQDYMTPTKVGFAVCVSSACNCRKH